MKPMMQQGPEAVRPSNLWDTLVRVALIGSLAWLCFTAFSPFLKLMVWSIILAINLYPAHQWLARKLGKRQGLASVLLVILGIALIVIPTWVLMGSFADSVQHFVSAVQQNTVHIPAPPESVKNLPLVGNKIYAGWSKAQTDLPGVVKTMQPQIGDLARRALSMVASVGGAMLLFMASFIVATILMAYGESAGRSGRSIFSRIAGPTRGESLAQLSIATIRAVAQGVIGVAAIQALLVGLALMLAGIKIAGILAVITLVLGIAQVPALLVTLPVIIYIWAGGDYGTGSAIAYTIILLLTGMADNILKPMMLGRGVDVPMPVILFGALGGMATGGILGMFVGATALALGYEIFMKWVAMGSESESTQSDAAKMKAHSAIAS
jgi:predicted PurR-regulated permease PerM